MNQFNMKAILACLIVICSGVSGLKIRVLDSSKAFVGSTVAENTEYFVTASGINEHENVLRVDTDRHCFVKGAEFAKLKPIMETRGRQVNFTVLVTGRNNLNLSG